MTETDFDDDLGRLLRAADPAPVDPDERPSLRALAVRDRIIAGHLAPVDTRAARQPAVRWWPLVMAPLAAIATVVLIVVWSVASPHVPVPAVAALTPPPLTFTADGRDLAQVIGDAQRALKVGGAVEPVRSSTTTGWYFHVDNVDSENETAVISPEVSVLTWAADQSGSMSVYAGEPYWADLSDVPLPADLRPAGTRLWAVEFAAGEAGIPDSGVPVATPESILALLQAHGLHDATDGFALFDAIERVQQSWTLPDAHHALLLDLVRDARGVTALGTANDRAGRPIAALSVDMPGGKSELHLLISQNTGRIVGTEVYMTDRSGPFRHNAIISYSMWDLPH